MWGRLSVSKRRLISMTSVDFTAKGFQGGRGGEASSRPSFSSPPSSSCPSTGFALFSFFDWSPTPLCARQVTAEWMRGSVPAVPSLNPTDSYAAAGAALLGRANRVAR